jgi:hypothetical protein
MLAVLAAALLAACGETGTPRTTVPQLPAKGYTVTVPNGWHRAGYSLTPTITDPVELLSLATSPFGGRDGICDALARVVPNGAFVTVEERGRGAYRGSYFPPRPARFRREPADESNSTWPYCGVPNGAPPIPMDDYWFGFSDAGRAFHVLVAFGKDAPEDVRDQAWAALDSLRLDPEVMPDWASTEAHVYDDARLGFSVGIPAGWRRARQRIDRRATNPRELLVVSSFELPELGAECGPFYDHIVDQMGNDQALVTVRERLGAEAFGPREFPHRPKRFELEPSDPELGGCPPGERRQFRSWWIPFEDVGRDFYAHVRIGLKAPDSLREDAARLLNSFRARP